MKIINIFTKVYSMHKNHALHLACNTIDIVLQKGAQKLYDKYITQKLPEHTYQQNSATLYNNLNLNQVAQPAKTKIQFVPFCNISKIPIDTFAPKRISVKKKIDNCPTLSPKNTTFGKSTKYQTIINSQRSTNDQHNLQNISDSSIFNQENFVQNRLTFIKERPMTMQNPRQKHELNNLCLDSKLQQVQEKRAATCHTRRRKAFVSSIQKQQKLIKISQDPNLHFYQDMETANRLRKSKKQRHQQQVEKDSQRAKKDAYIRMKERKAKEHFQDLRKKLKGKSKQSPALTNVQTNNETITINGRQAHPTKAHIIQLQFNPEQQKTLKIMQAKIGEVNATKKSSFISKLKKKLKISSEQFTNNGERQLSSIPFINLSCGIVLSQSTIDATASRRRPAEQLTRQQFYNQNSSNRFKSHNPIVSSARINIFATIDEANQSGRSSALQNNFSIEKKDFQTTLESRKEMKESILWKNRGRSQSKNIRISNIDAFNQQILEIKQGN